MTHEQWAQAYWEMCKRDFERMIYKECEKLPDEQEGLLKEAV